MSFWGELRRRNVVKVGAAYAVLAWLLIQIAAAVFPQLNLPQWGPTLVTVLLLLGFPVALLLAWAYELTPEGIRKTRHVPLEESITHATGQKLNYVVTGLLALAVAFIAADEYLFNDRTAADDAAPLADGPAASVAAADSATPDSRDQTVLPNSVAVLPFENLSPDPDDAYFAAGLHEEVLNQLSQLQNLSVIARTTMRQYANTEKSIDQIAAELNVATVMEGSVRYANGRIRVTTQLIDGQRGVHLWSETYERDFEDIFQIESDIAMNVANQMAVEFSEEEQDRIEEVPTDSAEAYALLLSARDSQRTGTPDGVALSLRRIDRATELDPNFARGWSVKAAAYTFATIFFPERTTELRATAESAARRALELDPDLSAGHVALAMIAANRGEWPVAATEFRSASELGMDPESLEPLASFQLVVGHIEAAYENVVKIRQRDPLNPNAAWWAVASLDALGEPTAALMEYARGKEIFDTWLFGDSNAFVTLLGSGEGERALELARQLVPNFSSVLEHFDSPDTAVAALRELYADDPSADRHTVALLAAYLGDQQLAMDALTDYVRAFPLGSHFMWRPIFREVRRREDFETLARDLGFVAYWQEFGWPDVCRPAGGDDFQCD